MFCLFFFFKQKTAYEMRISDWSSDVCSSDLRHRAATDRINAKLTIFGNLGTRQLHLFVDAWLETAPELREQRFPLLFTARDRVEFIFEVRREFVIDVLREMIGQELVDDQEIGRAHV